MPFKVYKEPCKNCLLSADAIVSPERVKDIIQGCIKEQNYFICHKSEDVCCNKFYHQLGHAAQLVRIADRLGMVEFVEHDDNEKLPSYRELNKNIEA